MITEGLEFPLYDVVFPESSDKAGVTVMSLVDKPACKAYFLKLSEQKEIKLSLNEEKRIITGVALRADFPIYREMNGEKFYVRFTQDVIESLMLSFMKAQKSFDVSLQHDTPIVDGVYLIESFLFNEKHNLQYPEFQGLENGSWIVSYKIENDSVWQDIKSGKINGFSPEIDALLSSAIKESSEEDKLLKDVYECLCQLIN